MILKKAAWFLYQPYKWLVFIPFLAVNTLVLSFSAILISYLTGTFLTRYVGVWWARLNGFFTPMFVKVRGRENMKKGQSYIIVSNHQSLYDIFVIYGWIHRHFKWVMKHSLRKVPGLGLYCDRMEHIFVDRTNTEKALQSIEAARHKITRGTCVLFFPEGTIFGHGTLGPFKKGAYKMAIDLNLPILPVTISGTENILPYKSINLFPGRAVMTIHEPISTEGYTEKTLNELVYESKKKIASALEMIEDVSKEDA